jgi:hypothetical protein
LRSSFEVKASLFELVAHYGMRYAVLDNFDPLLGFSDFFRQHALPQLQICSGLVNQIGLKAWLQAYPSDKRSQILLVDPNGAGAVSWPQYDPSTDSMLQIDDTQVAINGYKEHPMRLSFNIAAAGIQRDAKGYGGVSGDCWRKIAR